MTTWDGVVTNGMVAILKLYRPETYGIDLQHGQTRQNLVDAGFIEWVPPAGWASSTWAITEKGKQWLVDNVKQD